MADTFGELVKIYNYMAPKYHCKRVQHRDIEILRNMRPQDFMKVYNVSKVNLPMLILRGRRLLKKKMHKINAFPYIVEVILELKKLGYPLGILSSNSQKNIETFIVKHNLQEVFGFIYNGKNIFGKSKKLKKIFKEQHLNNTQVIMIGDETRDIEASQKMGVPVIAVGWGFNKEEVLKEMNPNALVNEPKEIVKVVEKLS
jgi:phosphoglycolate phosphatase